MPSSTASPSTWWKCHSWVASVASYLNALPGTITLTGGCVVSMILACMGDVWVLSSMGRLPSSSTWSTHSVSHMSRAGWSLGMLSMSKLYRSHSTSGPSSTPNPMDAKTSVISRMVWVTGWSLPCGAGQPGSVTSIRSCSTWSAMEAARSPRSRASMSPSSRLFARLAAAPTARLSSWSREPSPRSRRVSCPLRPRYATRHLSTPSASTAASNSRVAAAATSSTCWTVGLSSLMGHVDMARRE